MPAWRLNPQPIEARPLDICGSDGELQNFVSHAFLRWNVASQQVSSVANKVPAVHSGPPLNVAELEVTVLGTVPLDSPENLGEGRRVKAFVDDRLMERKSQEARLKKGGTIDRVCADYIVLPHFAEPSPMTPLWRFSCSGFVLKAYEEAGIRLLADAPVPSVTMDVVKQAYQRFNKLLDNPEIRARLGLAAGERWPIVLPGYVLNATNRSPELIRSTPYIPSPEDAYFPPRVCEASASVASVE